MEGGEKGKEHGEMGKERRHTMEECQREGEKEIEGEKRK